MAPCSGGWWQASVFFSTTCWAVSTPTTCPHLWNQHQPSPSQECNPSPTPLQSLCREACLRCKTAVVVFFTQCVCVFSLPLLLNLPFFSPLLNPSPHRCTIIHDSVQSVQSTLTDGNRAACLYNGESASVMAMPLRVGLCRGRSSAEVITTY